MDKMLFSRAQNVLLIFHAFHFDSFGS
uniref:Uncharacterized protein n=1 Tax=Anguilla anguilla TaxID=7936 RepID=A0A0E9TCQ8_ANGAN